MSNTTLQKKVLFISTNEMWSGSEELWVRTATELNKLNYEIFSAAKFNNQLIENINGQSLNYFIRFIPKNLLKRIAEKFEIYKFEPIDLLKKYISDVNPDLIVISQGNNYESVDVMKICIDLKLRFVTLTQLVSELFSWSTSNDRLVTMQFVYSRAEKNYFVSNHNLLMHNFILGKELSNSELVYNPCKIANEEVSEYPDANDLYTVALVGRIEFIHKGYDLFLQVIKQNKWKERAVQFNVYGKGPHEQLFKAWLNNWEIKNVVLKGHSNSIADVWKDNQLLLMPSRMEGQALALIEAMRCQRAAIVTNVGGATELIEEGISGFIAEATTPDSIDAALERAWAVRTQWKQLGINAGKSLKEKQPADAVAYFVDKIKSLV